MTKTTQRFIKNLSDCIDITNYNSTQIKQLYAECDLTLQFISYGVYGINAAAFKDQNNNWYKITCRNSNLFFLV